MEPKEDIFGLISKTRTLLKSYNNDISSGISSNNASIAGELLRKTIIPHGLKTFTKDTAKKIKRDSQKNIDTAYLHECKKLLFLCKQNISKMSLIAKNLTEEGNTNRLIRKFNKISGFKTPEAILNNLISTLEQISSLELIYNEEIPAFVSKKSLSEVNTGKYKEIVYLLNSYPIVKQNFLAAITALQYRRIGSNRNCITSCRVVIERLCLDIGKERDWKKSLKVIFSSKSDQQMVINTWNYLSGKGAHGGHEPTKEEAAYCLDMTISTIKHIVKMVQNPEN